MDKKVGLGLSICLLLMAVGGLYHWRASKRQPVASHANAHARLATEPSNSGAPLLATPRERSSTAEPAAKAPLPGAEPALSPHPGETLEFSANVTKLNSTVANLKIVVAERKNFAGKSSWHLQAFAHTENPYRMVFELDDQFDSYSEANNMTSLQYEMHLSERGQRVDSVQRMLPSAKDPAPAGTTAARVLPGTRDPLGMLQYLRGVDWSKTPEVRSPVYDGHKLYDVRAAVLGRSEAVTVPAGNYSTSKIELHVFDSGVEMKDAHFLLFLANDAARLPVLLEAVLPIAAARVELTKAN
jgi:hypothetical protein